MSTESTNPFAVASSLRLNSHAAAILLELLDEEAIGMTDIAKMCGVSTAAVTGTVDRLVKRQFVERRSVDGDRRSIHITITDEGRNVAMLLRPMALVP